MGPASDKDIRNKFLELGCQTDYSVPQFGYAQIMLGESDRRKGEEDTCKGLAIWRWSSIPYIDQIFWELFAVAFLKENFLLLVNQ